MAVVLGAQVWVEVVSRTGDAGFAGVWVVFATAPLSILALWLVTPGPAAPVAPPDGLVHTGPQPPTPLPSELAPPPDGWPAESPLSEQPEVWAGFGLYGAVLAGALMNATLLWALVRVLVRRTKGTGCAEG